MENKYKKPKVLPTEESQNSRTLGEAAEHDCDPSILIDMTDSLRARPCSIDVAGAVRPKDAKCS